MTICIAAVAKQARAIVAVSDTKLSDTSYSHEFGALKIRSLRNRWSLMYSGSPTTYERLQRRINSKLQDGGNPKDVDSMVAAIEAAYDAELLHFINREILLPLNMTREEFDTVGAVRLTEKVFSETIAKMEAASTARWNDPNRTELIALGIDDFGEAHIIQVSGTGDCSENYELGFCIIGSGEPLARAYLGPRSNFHLSPRLGEVCYHLQAAKLAAEGSPHVGERQTITTVFHFDGRLWVNYGAKATRAHFEAELGRPIPEETIAAVESSLTRGWSHPT